jgi:disulfide bond formation protein DsbB
MEFITSVLALVAGAGALLIVAARALAPTVPVAGRWGAAVVARRAPLTAAVAVVSMAGSLYFSEFAHFVPCRLCWYQRIAMYPLVIILAIAALRRDRGVRVYALPLVGAGAIIALYQYVLGYLPDAEVLGCSIDVSCTERYVWEFGFVDFPFMSLVAFLLIGCLLACIPHYEDEG